MSEQILSVTGKYEEKDNNVNPLILSSKSCSSGTPLKHRQATFDTFMQKVERTTDIMETQKPQLTEFPPKPDMLKAQEVTKQLSKTWNKMQYKADFDTFLDIMLAALERREEDYMKLIGTLDKDVVNCYATMHGSLMAYFIDGYYGDPLGTFYMERFSYGNNGEFFTPWNVAYFMAEILNPKPTDTVCDPCVGSGIMLLAVRCVIHKKYGWLASSRYGRNLYGIDISDRMTKMAKINLYLTDYVYMICVMQDVVSEAHEKVNIKTGNMLMEIGEKK